MKNTRESQKEISDVNNIKTFTSLFITGVFTEIIINYKIPTGIFLAGFLGGIGLPFIDHYLFKEDWKTAYSNSIPEMAGFLAGVTCVKYLKQ